MSDRMLVQLTVVELEALIDARLAAVAPSPAPRCRLLTGPELQVELGVSAPTVRGWRRDGCPHVLVGIEPRWEADRVLEWLRARSAGEAL